MLQLLYCDCDRELHQRLDPTRILKRGSVEAAQGNEVLLHQRLDPTRILKLLAVDALAHFDAVAPEARSDEDTETGGGRRVDRGGHVVAPEARSDEDTET